LQIITLAGEGILSVLTEKKPSYRPDIDGLRAIAVLSVIVFHINKTLIPGGFTGVDIFFVISGYLISLHIMTEVALGRFSLAEFYRRRIKRIALPMLLVVFVTVLVAPFIMLAADVDKVAHSALYSLLPLANVYFWLFQDTSYFAADSSLTPLLHMWSLGIEEQFYILWPLLLMGAYSLGRTRLFFIIATVVAIASFTFGELYFSTDPSFVYYMLPSRAGELLMGALVALAAIGQVEKKMPQPLVLPIAVVGLLLIVGSFFLLSEDQAFPGLRAIPPTLGTALLILAGHCAENPISRLLSIRIFVVIGLLSYSAYLWHWPMLAYYRYVTPDVTFNVGVVVFILTFVLAWLTYAIIELRARASLFRFSRVFMMQFVIPSCAIAVLAITLKDFDASNFALPSSQPETEFSVTFDQPRSSDEVDMVFLRGRGQAETGAESALLFGEISKGNAVLLSRKHIIWNSTKLKKWIAAYEYDYVCQRTVATRKDAEDQHCILGPDGLKPSEPARVVLWGDSNAAQYVGMVGAMARKAGFSFRNIEPDSCPPIFQDTRPFTLAKRRQDCVVSGPAVFPAIRSADVVIMGGDWPGYQERARGFYDAMHATIKELTDAGKRVIILGKSPEIPGYDRDCREKALHALVPMQCVSSSPILSKIVNANERLATYAKATPQVEFFDVTPYLCKNGVCPAFTADGSPLYFNFSHISMRASWQLGEAILREDGVPAPFSLINGWLQASTPAETELVTR